MKVLGIYLKGLGILTTNNSEKYERLGLEQNALKKCCRNELIDCICHLLAKIHLIKKKKKKKNLL